MTSPPSAPPLTFTTISIAQLLGGELIGRPDLILSGIGGLDEAGPGTLAFIRSDHYAAKWSASRAPAALVSKAISVPGHDPATRALIIVPDADRAMVQLLGAAAQRVPIHKPAGGVHPSATVDPTAIIAPTAAIGPGCVVGPGCRIGENAVLHARVTLGMGVSIGAGTVLYPNVVAYDRSVIGNRCILHSGVIIGADGFGYLPDAEGGRGGKLIKVPHIGNVEIGDDVEIGANSCVDRAKFGSTVIGSGTKIDNLVQIGHNCHVGRSVIICGQSGLAGSARIGDGAILAGHVGIADGISVGARARIAAKSGVFNDVPDGENWVGYPAMGASEGRKNFAAMRHVGELLREVRAMRREDERAARKRASPGE